MVSDWQRLLFGLAALALAVLPGCEQPPQVDHTAKAIRDLIELAERNSDWPERDVTPHARRIFLVGKTAESYASVVSELGFKKSVDTVRGRRFVIFRNEGLRARFLEFGSVEPRIDLATDAGDLIESVSGKVILHTL